MLNNLIKYVERYRRIIAVILVLLTELAGMVFLVNKGKSAIVTVLLMTAVAFAVSAILFYMGTPAAAMISSYIIMILTGFGIGKIITAFIQIPELIVKDSVELYSVIIIMILVMNILVPVKLKRYVIKTLYGTTPEIGDESSEDQNQTESSGIKYNKSYYDYVVMKGQHKYRSRSYSMENQTERMKAIRIICGIFSIMLGFVGLIFACLAEEQNMFSHLHAYRSLVCIASVVLCVFGGFIFILGIIRSFILVIVSIVVCGIAGWTSVHMVNIFQESALKFFLLLNLIIICLITILHLGVRFYWNRWAGRGFVYYNNDDRGVYLDLSLNSVMPMGGYTKLIIIEAFYEPNTGVREINEIIAKIRRFADLKKMVFCGYMLDALDIENLKITLYVYSYKNNHSIFHQIMSGFRYKELKISCEEDREWKKYSEDLYPDQYTLFTIGNTNLNAYLESIKYDFSVPISVIYILTFEKRKDVSECEKYILQEGYKAYECTSNADSLTDYGLPQKFIYYIYIQNVCMAGIEQLNAQILKVMGFAKKYNGELYNFDLGELRSYNSN